MQKYDLPPAFYIYNSVDYINYKHYICKYYSSKEEFFKAKNKQIIIEYLLDGKEKASHLITTI